MHTKSLIKNWHGSPSACFMSGGRRTCRGFVLKAALPNTRHKRQFCWCRVRKETGSQVLASWNKEAKADSSLYGVKEAAVAAVCNCLVRACSTLTLSVLLGMCLGYLGACLYSSLACKEKTSDVKLVFWNVHLVCNFYRWERHSRGENGFSTK